MPLDRLLAASILAGTIGAMCAASQSAPAVHIPDTSFSLRRGQTTFVRVRINVPPDIYVPAESRGPFTGARLEVISTSILNNPLPTYPTPTPRALPGLRQPVLAYQGLIDIGLPLFAAPGLNGPQEFHLAFTYQRCNSQQCEPVETLDAVEHATIVEPVTEPFSIAFRLDATRVLIPLPRDHSAVPTDNLSEERPVATLAPPFAAIPDAQNSDVSAGDGAHVGDTWTMFSNGYVHQAAVQHVGFLADGCGDPGSRAVSAIVSERFGRDRAKYFLAARSPIPAAASPRIASVSLDSMRRAALVDLVNRQFRATYPSIIAPQRRLVSGEKAAGLEPVRRASDVRFDRAVELGLARTTYDVQTFRLSPDEHRQFLVRAAWTAGNRSLHMSFWLRSDGGEFIVEQTDAWEARQRRLDPKMFGRRDFTLKILNVVPSADGWSYVIVGRTGYESISISALKYGPRGLEDTGIAYGYGC